MRDSVEYSNTIASSASNLDSSLRDASIDNAVGAPNVAPDNNTTNAEKPMAPLEPASSGKLIPPPDVGVMPWIQVLGSKSWYPST
ncbi:hypothetical protein PWT90_00923 [Aphanocladium album]|nr:hypothetical protein PWT90_00923 [Aphanocladium album]